MHSIDETEMVDVYAAYTRAASVFQLMRDALNRGVDELKHRETDGEISALDIIYVQAALAMMLLKQILQFVDTHAEQTPGIVADFLDIVVEEVVTTIERNNQFMPEGRFDLLFSAKSQHLN